MNVHIDGRFIDQTPINNYEIQPGLHDVVLKQAGYKDIPRRWTFESGKELVLVVDLKEEGIPKNP